MIHRANILDTIRNTPASGHAIKNGFSMRFVYAKHESVSTEHHNELAI